MTTPHSVNDRGAALVLALTITAMVTALATALVVSSTAETLISASARTSQELLYALDAGLERALGELADTADWSAVLSASPGNRVASFDDGARAVRMPDGRSFSVGGLTTERQAASDAIDGPSRFGADTPQWRLYARADLSAILPPGLIAPPAYVLVWVADDGGDGDGDAARDTNGLVLVHAEAYGVSGALRGVDAAVARAAPGGIRVVSWRDMR